jgi:phosphatidylethanolamine/phosphatidyl-N-methylethanolamine N-methyltransferase
MMSNSNTDVRLQPRWLTFLWQWLKSPRSMASVAPSGRQLGQLMADALPAGFHRIVELGAGTGAITDALVRHGISPTSLLAVEMNPILHEVLARRFPQLHLAHGDARHLRELVIESGAFVCGEVDAVLSSLGLLSMPKELQRDILAAAFDVLRADGVFIQYTYGRSSPLDEDVCRQLGLRSTQAGLAWRNLPPARVYVYRKG